MFLKRIKRVNYYENKENDRKPNISLIKNTIIKKNIQNFTDKKYNVNIKNRNDQ